MVWPRVSLVLGVYFAIAVISQPLSAEVVNVLVLDYEASTDAGFGEDGRYEDAYDGMLDAANFGPNGIVNRTFNFMNPVSSLSGVSLDNVGLVILAHSHQKSTEWQDGVDVSNFMYYDGGSVLALGHSFSDIELNGNPPLSEWWSNRFANRVPGSGWAYKSPEDDNMTVNAVGEGPANGPFGDVQGTTVLSDANEYWSGNAGGTTGTFAITYQTGGQDGLYGVYGAGQYMMLGSVNMIGDGDIGTSMLSSRYDEANNAEFFLNTIDYLTSGASAAAAPEPSSFVLMAAAGVAALVRQRKKRRLATPFSAS
jgi:hypothetical protein